ncbi:MAG TPA: hypothetical protein VMJ10_33695 [Kofleriaceae bacterium]|nr:hypothetical protein [Kofleriaceae bacterium]
MNRIILCLVVALAATASRPARADEPPTKEQLDQAKKAFAEGKALHDQGKLLEAVEKFKESYRLSKNPLLLYNIGLTLDEAGQKDNALLYYRRFLSDAPAEAAQRQTASDRVKVLEKEKLDADLGGGAKTEPTNPPANPATNPTPKATKFKPPGTYSATDFQHQAVDSAPPGKPLDVTAYVPEDSGFSVTLFFRASGESTFTARPMKWRYKELVGRIPAKKMAGTSLQYYLEVKDTTGAVIARSGKSTDPNLISVEAEAPPHFYMDFQDDAASTTVAGGTAATAHHEDEDPLHPKTAQVDVTPPEQHTDDSNIQIDQPAGEGFLDVGSKKFKYAKWTATYGGGALLVAGVATYILAGHEASLIEGDTHCGSQPPPCRQFDSQFDKAWQDAGQRYQTISNVTLTLGIIGAGVAGYYWYRELKAKKPDEPKPAPAAKAADPDMSWLVVPAVGDGFAGAAAMARF